MALSVGRRLSREDIVETVGAHVALDKQRSLLRVDPGGDQQRGQFAGLAAQGGGILRHGDRVQIDDADEIGLLALAGDPLLDRAQVIADMQHPRGLDTRKDAGAPWWRGHG